MKHSGWQSTSHLMLVTNQTSASCVQGQKSLLIQLVQTRPMGSVSGNGDRFRPGVAVVRTGDHPHLTSVNSAPRVMHERSDERASDVDNLRCSGDETLGRRVDPATGVPACATVCRSHVHDGELTELSSLEDAAVQDNQFSAGSVKRGKRKLGKRDSFRLT